VTLGVLKVAADNPVDLVISGVNDGCNVAEDLGYSGTVGAALEGAVLGVPSFAVSLDLERGGRFDEAAQIAGLIASAWLYGARFPWHDELVGSLGDAGGEDGWSLVGLPRIEAERYPRPAAAGIAALTQTPVMNVNIPGLPLAEIRGIRWTIAGHREYRDVVREAADPRGRPYYWLGGEKIVSESEQEGTDTHALLNGCVSVTPVSYDITNRTDLPVLKRMLRERMGKAGSQNGHE
jgi:5'-nucleotidase